MKTEDLINLLMWLLLALVFGSMVVFGLPGVVSRLLP